MDAQNAVESATTVQATSPSRRADKPVDSKLAPPVATTINNASTLANGHISPEPRDTTKNHAASSPSQDAENWQDQNSDAETIVLAGKDGTSPSKPRQGKFIKHEDKSDGELADAPQPVPRKALKSTSDAPRNGSARTAEDDEHRRAALVMGKKRLHDREKHQRTQDGSSGLSSVPASPPAHRRRRSGDARSDSGSEEQSKARAFSGGPNREKSRNGDKNFAAKRKSAKLESDDDEPKKIRRPRMSDIMPDSVASKDRDQRSLSAKFQQSEKTGNAPRDRSHSPHGRPHRRSLSTQLPSQSTNGLTSKKRRPPPPLQSTDYHSDDSTASASSHQRNSKVRRLATPLTAESTMSPATKAGHKRHVDNHGQTQFAKACAKGEYEVAKRRLGERPEDLDFADYAGNTPLQVAALNGHEDIVQLLIQAGCNIDCRNSDKETPLLDAVENGHLEVVKLLLDAGVNPRKADAEGHEPLEKVPDDVDNAEEIRAVLREAKDKSADFRPSEDRLPQDMDTVSSQGPDSPRRSPQASAAAQRRGGTMRSTKTSNHLLYMNLDEKTLRHAAARGDEETVTRVLQVREGCDDPEALVGAARGGHNVVMELLLALGGANPDPAPVKGLPPQYSTPMLAAIGQENVKVIKLLLNQSGFDPTRRFKGESYHEIARRREGPLWKEEEHMLKNAYDDYRRTKGLTKKATSGIRREREVEAEGKRASRKESSPETSRPPKRRLSTTREDELKKKPQSGKASGDAKEKRRADNTIHQDDPPSPKRVAARPRKDEVVVNTNSDRESTPGGTKVPALKQKRAESDLAAGSSDGEAFKPRRKLISGRDLKGQRDKQRRSSMASIASNDKADVKPEDAPEKPRAERPSEKYHDRTKALKRDDSRDGHSGGEGAGKRHRGSVTPPRQGVSEKDDGEAPTKRRRLDADSREVRHGAGSSPDGRKKKREVSPDSHRRSRPEESDRRDRAPKVNRERALSVRSTTSERGSITVASEVPEVEMRDAHVSEGEITDNYQTKETSNKEVTKKRQAEAAEQEKKAEERKRREEQEAARKREEQEKERAVEEKRLKEEAAKRQAQEEEQKRAAAAEDEQRRQRERDAAEKKRLEEEEKARVEKERLEREERERKERDEAERKRREDVQKQEAEAKKLREAAEEEKRKEEEARIRREREAAEEARKLREEEERKERDRKRAAREAEREAELQRIRQEQEQTRLSRLPPVLRWLDTCTNPKQRQYAELFTMAQGVRYDTINPAATGTPAGREQWLLNTQVALLLGDKDLSLSRYTGWEKVKATNIAKKVIWRLENERYALTQGKLYGLGMELPSYFDVDPHTMGYKQLEKLRGDAAKLFFEMDLWFVKVSDFLHLVPTIPHLLDLKISIDYRELPETESALSTWGAAPAKWKQDPDASSRGYFAPRWKYYMNGILIGEDRPKAYKLSHDPFPERRVPRRGGLIAVGPDEPDYPRLCLEQGLGHLLTEEQRQAALAGAHLTPQSMVSTEAMEENQQMSPSERGSTKHVADFGNEPASPLAQ